MDLAIAVTYLAAGLAALWHTIDQLVLLRWARLARGTAVPANPPEDPANAPFVVVQLPLYNEPQVAERLLDAVARLDYPDGRWLVQVLDDSTDATPELVEHWIARHPEAPVSHVRRDRRTGFKAGALAEGLARTPEADLVAVLDADFVPAPDYLRRATVRFQPGVGVVQGAWGHLNPDQNLVTIAGAVMMDNHFHLEQPGRQQSGSFRAFNGTAGLIRADAIREVGGWRATTLTEDFDLSLRLQLAGWRVAYDPAIEVPAELPATLSGLRLQQHRWMRGVAQNARLHLARLAGSAMPASVRVHLVSQLLETTTFVAIAIQVLLAPLVAWRIGHGTIPGWVGWNLPLAAAFAGLAPVYLFSLRPRIPSLPLRWWRYLQFIVVSASLSLHNALAVLAGWTGRPADFERTPKAGDAGSQPARPAEATRPASPGRGRPRRATRLIELALSFGLIAAIAVVVVLDPGLVGFLWPSLGWSVGTLLLIPAGLRQL